MASKRRARRVEAAREASQCSGKERMTEVEAIGKRDRVQGQTGAKMTHYRCNFCKSWHIAHAKNFKPRKVRR